MNPKVGQIWHDSTDYRNRRVRIIRVDEIQVTFREPRRECGYTTWLTEDFLKDAIYCEHETVKAILKRYK